MIRTVNAEASMTRTLHLPRPAARGLALASLAAVLGLGASAAHAAPVPLEDPDTVLTTSTPARFVMGFKAGAGATLWDTPKNTVLSNVDDPDPTFDIPLFDETRGGYTMSTGFFMEGIFYDYLGLEVGAYFTQHTLLETVDWSYFESVNGNVTRQIEAKSEEELSWTALHVPILVKAVVPSGKTRISLGVGPEFSFASWKRTKFKITEVTDNGVTSTSGDLTLPGIRGALKSLLASLQDSVYLTVNFGIEIVAGDFLIPIDIHWSYNFSQGSDYLDRAHPDQFPGQDAKVTEANHPTSVTLKTRDTMYGGIRIGIAYQFD